MVKDNAASFALEENQAFVCHKLGRTMIDCLATRDAPLSAKVIAHRVADPRFRPTDRQQFTSILARTTRCVPPPWFPA